MFLYYHEKNELILLPDVIINEQERYSNDLQFFTNFDHQVVKPFNPLHMTIYLSLSAPEHSHLIVNYHEIFPEHNVFGMQWDCAAIPRPGDILDFLFITDLVGAQVNTAMLPKIWQVMDIKWLKQAEGIIPVLNVVGK